MKRKIVIYSTAGIILGLTIWGASMASANGLFGNFGSHATPEQIASSRQTMFQNEANILGINIDEVKNAWAQGKSFSQLALDKGLTQAQLQTKLKEFQLQQYKTQLSALVSHGVITQSQADQRLQFVQNQSQNGKGKKMGRGYHLGLGMGMGL